MMTKQRLRLIWITCLAGMALLLLAVSPALAQNESPAANTEECTGCHEGLRVYWEESPHGQALDNPVFQEKWQEAGSPTECLECHTTGYNAATGEYAEGGVACLTCHSPVPANHPDNMIPTDVSSRKCGTCHVDTFNEWEVSQHGKENMNCNQCHNPHTTELRAEHSQALCQSCHHQETHYYSQTGHAKEGLLCTDCHLRVDSNAELGEGHAMSNHTFAVDLQTCNQCHADAAHPETAPMETVSRSGSAEDVACYPAQVIMETVPVVSVPEPAVTETPAPHISPLVYILPLGLGLVFGIVAAPLISKNLGKRREEDDVEGGK
jgi:hypothetical protein